MTILCERPANVLIIEYISYSPGTANLSALQNSEVFAFRRAKMLQNSKQPSDTHMLSACNYIYFHRKRMST